MRAISCCLYMTSIYHAKIQKRCVDFLACASDDQVGGSQQLSDRLMTFRSNAYRFKEYCDNPSLPYFEWVGSAHQTNLEIVSFLFLLEIRIYAVTPRQNVLSCSALNNNFSRCARLLKSKDHHFDVLFEDQTFSNLIFCQNIVLNVVNNLFLQKDELGAALFKDYNNGRYINLETEVAAASPRTARKNSTTCPPPKRSSMGFLRMSSRPRHWRSSPNSKARAARTSATQRTTKKAAPTTFSTQTRRRRKAKRETLRSAKRTRTTKPGSQGPTSTRTMASQTWTTRKSIGLKTQMGTIQKASTSWTPTPRTQSRTCTQAKNTPPKRTTS